MSCVGKITNILGKSTSPAFKDVQIGDEIEFSVPLEAVGGNRSTYAVYIDCTNLRTKGMSCLSFNQLGRIMEKFEFQEVNI
jgi:hypothetical protein